MTKHRINDMQGDSEKLEKIQEFAQKIQSKIDTQIELSNKLDKLNEQIRLLKQERKKIKQEVKHLADNRLDGLQDLAIYVINSIDGNVDI